jgi:proline iminopeptidase
MHHSNSAADDQDWKYSEPDELVNDGWLPVGSGHEIYWHEYGTPHGEPVMFLHGGPGGGTKPKQARFFNPRRYRIILFDQRGCGKSRPNAGDKNSDTAAAALKDNTTDHLIKDIEALRSHLGFKAPIHMFGGSWGSTLALAYAIKFPQCVKTLILRGIFLCRQRDLDYFYQGNAATYNARPIDSSVSGAHLFYPDAWKKYVSVIADKDRGNMVRAYAKIFDNPAHPDLERAVKAWSGWEDVTSNLAPEEGGHANPQFARAFARLENLYFMNGGFLDGKKCDNNYLLDNVRKIARLPIYIVQGRFDQVCPRYQADELVAALREANAKSVKYIVTTAGHSQYERETMQALTKIMDDLSSPARPGHKY